MYHTHSGVGLVGASIWDLYILMKELDPAPMGVNYDVGHATIEGGAGGWINSFRIIGPHLRGIAVKDFLWAKDAKGEWQPQWKPLGEGMVQSPADSSRWWRNPGSHGPLQLHFEYPLGGADGGAKTITASRQEIFGAMKRDLSDTARLSGAGRRMKLRRREILAMPACFLAARSTDARIDEIRTGFEDYLYRAPYKFGGKEVDRVTLLNVQCRLSTRGGQTAEGFAAMPLGNMWSFPAPNIPYDTTLAAMKSLA